MVGVAGMLVKIMLLVSFADALRRFSVLTASLRNQDSVDFDSTDVNDAFAPSRSEGMQQI